MWQFTYVQPTLQFFTMERAERKFVDGMVKLSVRAQRREDKEIVYRWKLEVFDAPIKGTYRTKAHCPVQKVLHVLANALSDPNSHLSSGHWGLSPERYLMWTELQKENRMIRKELFGISETSH